MASTSHGPLFDVFTAASGSPHGGAQFDEFDKPNTGATRHGARYDEGFRAAQAADSHGEHWDEFGWIPMPARHGQNFDSDFRDMTTLDGVDHGSTWYDVFRGGTQVRAIVDGKDVEAVVAECHPDHVVLELRRGKNQGGGRVEAGLGQIKELRHATQQGQASETRKPVASPGNTPAPHRDSTAHAPSAHSASAHGGGERTTIEVSEAKAIHVTGKSMADTLDVLKDLAAEVAPQRPFDGGDGDVAKAVTMASDSFGSAPSGKTPLQRAEWHHQRGANAATKALRSKRSSPAYEHHASAALHHYAQSARYYREHVAGAQATPIVSST